MGSSLQSQWDFKPESNKGAVSQDSKHAHLHPGFPCMLGHLRAPSYLNLSLHIFKMGLQVGLKPHFRVKARVKRANGGPMSCIFIILHGHWKQNKHPAAGRVGESTVTLSPRGGFSGKTMNGLQGPGTISMNLTNTASSGRNQTQKSTSMNIKSRNGQTSSVQRKVRSWLPLDGSDQEGCGDVWG